MKPTWHADVPRNPDGSRQSGVSLCASCGWRSVRDGTLWCLECTKVARSLGGPKGPPPAPIKAPVLTTSAARRRGYSKAQQEYIDSLLPQTCRVCGRAGHTSADHPVETDQAATT